MGMKIVHSLPLISSTLKMKLLSVAASAVSLPPVDFHLHGSDWLGRCAAKGTALLSPIDLSTDAAHDGHFHAQYALIDQMVVTNDGSKLSFTPDVDSILYLGSVGASHEGHSYTLSRIDVRAAAEHTFQGRRRPIEIQMVHTSEFVSAPLIMSIFYDCKGCKVVAAPGALEQLNVTAGLFLDPNFEHDANAEIDDVKTLVDASAVDLALRARSIGHSVATSRGNGTFATLLDALKGSPAIGMNNTVSFSPPLDLNALISKSDFFQYSGSLTLPPCSPATWLVQNGHVSAPFTAIEPVFNAVKKLSNGFGNFRAVQARTARPVLLLAPLPADRGFLPKSLTDKHGYWTPTAHTLQRESEVLQPAKDAITIAKAAVDYTRNLDQRLKNSANERAAVWEDGPVAPSSPDPPDLTVTDKAQQVAGETQHMAQNLIRRMTRAAHAGRKGLTFQKLQREQEPKEVQLTADELYKLLLAHGKKAVDDAVDKIVPEVHKLGRAYLRQNLLKNVPGVTEQKIA